MLSFKRRREVFKLGSCRNPSAQPSKREDTANFRTTWLTVVAKHHLPLPRSGTGRRETLGTRLCNWQQLTSVTSNISFERDFPVTSAFKLNNQPGTIKCAGTRCKTCPFTSSITISGSNRSVKITEHFKCFRKHGQDVEKRKDTDALNAVARHFNLYNFSPGGLL